MSHWKCHTRPFLYFRQWILVAGDDYTDCELIRFISGRAINICKVELTSFEENSENKNFGNVCREVVDIRKRFRLRRNFVKDEKCRLTQNV